MHLELTCCYFSMSSRIYNWAQKDLYNLKLSWIAWASLFTHQKGLRTSITLTHLSEAPSHEACDQGPEFSCLSEVLMPKEEQLGPLSLGEPLFLPRGLPSPVQPLQPARSRACARPPIAVNALQVH